MNELYMEMEKDALIDIIDMLEKNGYTGWYTDLHHEVFNTEYYVEDNETAKEILGNNVYDAIGRIYEYEKNNFGEIYTDFSDPKKIVNMLYYIIGEELMWSMGIFEEPFMDDWNIEADAKTNERIIARCREELEKY